jgi:hypothetical protein
MSSITNVNQNSAVVNVGRTTPVAPGAQTADKSIPVVMASDQTAIPVEEQNKVQSEVALSLLGIPRAEVALGIFADVNTYDVNPTEWSMDPEYHTAGDGVKHLPTEAGALVEASRNKVSVLTSKRFFRYQPGRVSAATFGIRSSVSVAEFARNPVIRKYGIYDKYDGYYWETRNNGQGDNFSCVRRTQSVANFPVSPYGVAGITALRSGDERATPGTVAATQLDDYKSVGMGVETESSEGAFVTDRQILKEKRYEIINNVLAENARQYHGDTSTPGTITVTGGGSVSLGRTDYYADLATAYNELSGINGFTAADMEKKCKRDLDYWIDFMLMDLEYDSEAHVKWNTTNFALSDGTSNWEGTAIGKFPKLSLFEKPLHKRLERLFDRGQLYPLNQSTGSGNYDPATIPVPTGADLGFTSGGEDKLEVLQNIVLTAFSNGDNFTPQIPVFNAATYGARFSAEGKLDAFFDVKKHFWAYYVTVTETNTQGVPNGNTIVYTVPDFGPSSNDAEDGTDNLTGLNYLTTLSDSEVQEFIRNKCQRDVVYVIDGYKNDVIGGGNAETTYNCQMFFRGTGLSVYSQEKTDGGSKYISEINRHQLLRDTIQRDLKTAGYTDSSATYVDVTQLANKVITNFQVENQENATLGRRGFAGNLVTLRDGLIHTHAAVYDPSLLKDSKKIKTSVIPGSPEATGAATFKITEGRVTYGQHVKISWTGVDGVTVPETLGDASNIFNGQVLRVGKVINPKATEFILCSLTDNWDTSNTTVVSVTAAEAGIDQSFNASNGTAQTGSTGTLGTIFIETVVPFMFPNDYNLPMINNQSFTSEIMTSDATTNNSANLGDGTQSSQRVFKSTTVTNMGSVPKGPVFPYMYSADDNLLDSTMSDANTVGFINTALAPTGNSNGNVNTIRSQIDNVNFHPEYVNWIKNNVKPEYWGVYEYRVPRSRFSHDSLDGRSATSPNIYSYPEDVVPLEGKGTRNRVYSDVATGVAGTARPGENFINESGAQEAQDSLYDFDFTKVTMLKIEFSWYGAVGALFLAYVPVSNGEARWVRVHHLRASNQLKIASLGNATLPITYTTYGGGSLYCGGDGEDTSSSAIDQGYGSFSHNIVKYGASYYIDGGDRGTVRLYSYNNANQIGALGKQFGITASAVDSVTGSYSASGNTLGGVTTASIVTNAHWDDNGSDDVIDARFFMGADVKTSNDLDQNVKVVWADVATNRVYLNKEIQGTDVASIKLMPDRAATVYGLETKKVILSTRESNAVRNRVQVYPTKLSSNNASSADTIRLRFKKTPIFQTKTSATYNGFTLTSDYIMDNNTDPLPIDYAADQTSPYIQNGEKTYGWFRGRIGAQGITAFGLLSKEGDKYYFEMLESFEGVVTLTTDEDFLPDLRFLKTGQPTTADTKSSSTIEGLSSLNIASDPVVPVPKTGTNVATVYLRPGTEQFDLATYFDYNKEYLSFPLTDIADSLYFAVDSDTAYDSTPDNISLGVTWEEQ